MSAPNIKKAPLAGWVWTEMKKLRFNSVFCPFSGNSGLALMFKEGGKEVTVCDLRLSAFRFGKALIENGDSIIDPFDTDALISQDVVAGSTVAEAAVAYDISPDEAMWLERVRANIEKFEEPLKKDLAYCVVAKVIDFLFSMRGESADVKPEEYIMPTFQYYVESLNEKVFPVKSHCSAYNDDANSMVFGVQSDAMMMYLPDPAGFGDMGPRSRFIELFNNYCSEDELDNLMKRPVQGLGAKLEEPEKYRAAVESFLDSAAHIPVWIVGSNQARPITDAELSETLRKFKKNVKVEKKELFFPEGTWEETLFVATD